VGRTLSEYNGSLYPSNSAEILIPFPTLEDLSIVLKVDLVNGNIVVATSRFDDVVRLLRRHNDGEFFGKFCSAV
jgi:hypothetical protein